MRAEFSDHACKNPTRLSICEVPFSARRMHRVFRHTNQTPNACDGGRRAAPAAGAAYDIHTPCDGSRRRGVRSGRDPCMHATEEGDLRDGGFHSTWGLVAPLYACGFEANAADGFCRSPNPDLLAAALFQQTMAPVVLNLPSNRNKAVMLTTSIPIEQRPRATKHQQLMAACTANGVDTDSPRGRPCESSRGGQRQAGVSNTAGARSASTA